MAQVLKVGSIDLSKYVRVAHEDGLDPANPEFSEPQFSGSLALGEGQSFVNDAVSNRLMSYPLILSAASTNALYQLVREINAKLVKGAQVEYRSGGSSQSTFFDLERGRLEPKFEFWIDQAARVRALLHLWVRPYGTSGTTRLIASIAAGSAAAVQFPATGVIGDENALANLEVRVGSAVATNGRVVMYGAHPHPSFNGIRAATSGLAQAGATVRGASGAVGSQYTAIPVSPTGASGIAYTAYLDPPEAHVGRHRVLAIARSGLSVPISLYAEDRFGAVLGPTAQATQTDVTKWQVIDLGEIQVPARLPGQEPVPTQYVNIIGGGNGGGSIIASPAFHLNRMIFLPIDYSAGILRTPGQPGMALHDTFARFPNNMLNSGELLDNRPIADTGHVWTKVGGYFGVYDRFSAGLAAVNAEGNAQTGATGFYDLASGALLADVDLKLSKLWCPNPSGAWLEAWAKRKPGLASAGIWSKLTLGPSPMVQIFVGDGTAATTLASTALTGGIATTILKGNPFNMNIRCIGGQANVYIATSVTETPVATAGHPAIAAPGNPAVRIQEGAATQIQGVNAQREALEFSRIDLSVLGASAPDIAAREYFRFEAYPERRAIQGNASVFKADRTAEHRGHLPQVAPVGLLAATGSAQVVVFQGEIDNVIGNDGPDIAVSVRERFTYLR